MRDIGHFIAGARTPGAGSRFGDIFDPNTGEVQARVALAEVAEIDRAVAAAKAAQPDWAATNPQRRARVMFEFKRLVEARMEELAVLLSFMMGWPQIVTGCLGIFIARLLFRRIRTQKNI